MLNVQWFMRRRNVTDKWTTGYADMTTARFTACRTNMLGGLIYAVGNSSGTSPTTNEAYDPVSDTWVGKAAYPNTIVAYCVVSVGDYLIGAGGSWLTTNYKYTRRYTPSSNSWSNRTDMPTARDTMAGAVVDGKIYVMGGYLRGSGTYVNANEMYDNVANTWTAKTDMPTARYGLAVIASLGKIYAIGGYTSANVQTNEEFDPVNNSWASKANMTTARNAFDGAWVDGFIYCIGGDSGGNVDVNERYDPVTNTWTTKTDMPTTRRGMGCAVYGGKIYVIGGYTTSEIKKVEVYEP